MKLPRKLKKAARHIMMVQHRNPITQIEDGTLKQFAFVSWNTIGDYPQTKSVRKVIRMARQQYIASIKESIQRQVEQMMQPIDMDEIKRRTEGLEVDIQ